VEIQASALFKALKDDQTAVVVCGTPAEAAELAGAVTRLGFGKARVKTKRLVPRLINDAEAGQAESYGPGDVIVLAKPMQKFASGTRLRAMAALPGGLLVQAHDLGILPLNQRALFRVYREEECSLGANDQVRITHRSRRKGLHDLHQGDVLRVSGIGEDGSIRLAGNQVLPPDCRHLEPFYACLPAELPRRVDAVIVLPSAFAQITADQLAPVVRGKIHFFGVHSAEILDWLRRGAARVLEAAMETADHIPAAVVGLHLASRKISRGEVSVAETPAVAPDIILPAPGASSSTKEGGMRISPDALHEFPLPVSLGARTTRAPGKPKKSAKPVADGPGSAQRDPGEPGIGM
jgi:hypothetical protein